ncbi:bacteriohopanetetrol glucosamine biosynthesis glycosyltransferase HpnI [Hyphomicrobium sp. 99]|uniref:bacteriohopanetetrol glucosamine biosynthesis glycosyltransferase HpnI n=1 Tax=Hyphomicrobium sp. 99 TaxID=1163419 RepID=UPI0005F7D6B1|nr:bacteriohopanetetrol glucosamine biosynthesis glycosyltransferase HpnI [Hyphomicrobium sp. 99]
MTSCLWLVCTLVAVIGSVYALLAALLVARFASSPKSILGRGENVSLIKPLYGAEPGLGASLETFIRQDYPADIQMICGVQDPADPAIAVVRNLEERFSSGKIELVASARKAGGNPKIANVLNIFPRAQHDVLILSDSDMRVEPQYVRDVVATLQQPEVGLVTCLYRGCAIGGFWSRLAAAAVDQHFLPSVLVGVQFGLAKPCFGSTIAIRRSTLAAIGGYEAFADTLADDYAMGDAVRKKGLKVAIAPFTVGHTFSENTFGELLAHELRWARTIRLVDGAGYAGSVITHPLPFALAALPLSGFNAIAWMILLGTLACRLFVPLQVERLPGGGKSSILLTPLRDMLSFAIFVASYVPGAVSWRGRRYSVGADGTVRPI